MPFDSIITRADADALIPEEQAAEVVKALTASSAVLQLYQTTTMSAKVTQQPVLASLPVAYWVSSDTGLKQTTKGNAAKIRPGRGALTLAELDQLAAIAASTGPDLHLDAMVRFGAWSCVRQGELFLASPAGLDGDGLWVSE